MAGEPGEPGEPGHWVAVTQAASAAPVRLFCFPHAGGGGGFFAPWREPLLPQIGVMPVTLPGRETRLHEPAHARLEELIGPLTSALAPHLDRPYAFLGHSMGSLVAYEAARRFSADDSLPDPLALFVSGRRAPQLPARRPPLHPLPEDDFLAAVARLNGTPRQVLDEPGLLRLFLPSLRADFTLNERYVAPTGGPLDCHVSALVGDGDPEAAPDELAGWRAVTRGGFSLRVFRGDHFYLKNGPPEVLSAVRADLLRLCGNDRSASHERTAR